MKYILERHAVLLTGIVLALGSAIFTISVLYTRQKSYATRSPVLGMREYTKRELSEYDGSGKHQQILLAFDGDIYDVSSGSAFYAPGGPYNFLAGTDATSMLRIAGGSIVKQKYPVVGKLSL